METTGEFRWCAHDNHVAQSSQPRSCWEQILIDYPKLTHAGTNKATTAPPPVTVEIIDAP